MGWFIETDEEKKSRRKRKRLRNEISGRLGPYDDGYNYKVYFKGNKMYEHHRDANEAYLNDRIERNHYKKGDVIAVAEIKYKRLSSEIKKSIGRRSMDSVDGLISTLKEALEMDQPTYYRGWRIKKIVSIGTKGKGYCYCYPIVYLYDNNKRIYFQLKHIESVFDRGEMEWIWRSVGLNFMSRAYKWLFLRSIESLVVIVSAPAKVRLAGKLVPKMIGIYRSAFKFGMNRIVIYISKEIIENLVQFLIQMALGFVDKIYTDALISKIHNSGTAKQISISNKKIIEKALSDQLFSFLNAKWKRKNKVFINQLFQSNLISTSITKIEKLSSLTGKKLNFKKLLSIQLLNSFSEISIVFKKMILEIIYDSIISQKSQSQCNKKVKANILDLKLDQIFFKNFKQGLYDLL